MIKIGLAVEDVAANKVNIASRVAGRGVRVIIDIRIIRMAGVQQMTNVADIDTHLMRRLRSLAADSSVGFWPFFFFI